MCERDKKKSLTFWYSIRRSNHHTAESPVP
jgi:hypothetical protein